MGDIEAWFNLGGWSLGIHVLLSQLLRYRIGWNSDLTAALFAVPNSAISPDYGFRLLRVAYWRFWRSAPQGMEEEGGLSRLMFFFAQLSGCLVPIGLLAVFVVPFLQLAFST